VVRLVTLDRTREVNKPLYTTADMVPEIAAVSIKDGGDRTGLSFVLPTCAGLSSSILCSCLVGQTTLCSVYAPASVVSSQWQKPSSCPHTYIYMDRPPTERSQAVSSQPVPSSPARQLAQSINPHNGFANQQNYFEKPNSTHFWTYFCRLSLTQCQECYNGPESHSTQA